MKILARCCEATTFLIAAWGFFYLGIWAGMLGFIIFLYVAYELKGV